MHAGNITHGSCTELGVHPMLGKRSFHDSHRSQRLFVSDVRVDEISTKYIILSDMKRLLTIVR